MINGRPFFPGENDFIFDKYVIRSGYVQVAVCRRYSFCMQNNPPLVSAVIPVYNGERFLAETIESVLTQTYPNIECIVVNDGSTDGTAEVAKSFGDKIRYFEKQNGGVSSTRNFGIERASGDYVAFLDADDLWLSVKVEKQMAFYCEHDDLGLVFTGSYDVNEQKGILRENAVKSHEALIEEVLLLGSATGRIPTTAIVPKSILNLVGKFDEQLSTSADADYICRLAREAKIAGVPEPLALYRVHGNQMHHNLNALEHDMNIVLDKLFSTPDVPDWIQRLRRRAYSRLESTLAVGYLSKGQYRRAMKHAAEAMKYQPGTLVGSVARLAASKLTA
jgi:glycosyltransferase involved in cell wall biosynthesis